MSQDQKRPAQTLDEFYDTFLPDPLKTDAERQAFYMAMGAMRGGDRALEITRRLRRTAEHGQHFKGFVFGHSGVGKSTELYRAVANLEPDFIPIRFSVPIDLDASGFKPFDVLLVIAQRIMEEINRRYQSNELVTNLPDSLLTDLERWYANCQLTSTTTRTMDVSGSGSAGAKGELLQKLVTLATEVKFNLRYGRQWEEKVTEQHMRTLKDLLELINRLLVEANALFETFNQQLVVIGEDFDKPGVDPARVEELFLQHKYILKDLKVHLLFNLPIALAYSEKREQLPEAIIFKIYDVPVHKRDNTPQLEGREALKELLYKRANPALFGPTQADRLVVASGGNLRDLFQMALEAADHGALAGRERIEEEDTTHAIQKLRDEFIDRMGVSPYDSRPISYEEKATKLLSIYHQEPGCEVVDLVLHSLLRARLVQEFNSTRWFGLAPMMVDVLKRHKKLAEDAPGGSI